MVNLESSWGRAGRRDGDGDGDDDQCGLICIGSRVVLVTNLSDHGKMSSKIASSVVYTCACQHPAPRASTVELPADAMQCAG